MLYEGSILTRIMQEYLFRIIIAAVLCAIIKTFTAKASVSGTIIKTLCGVFLTVTVLSGITNLDFPSINQNINLFYTDAHQAVETGVQMNLSSMGNSIKEQTEAYVLDKAALVNAELSVEVTLSNDDPPVPYSIILDGHVSPYAKSKLTKLISDELGISKENQTWT